MTLSVIVRNSPGFKLPSGMLPLVYTTKDRPKSLQKGAVLCRKRRICAIW